MLCNPNTSSAIRTHPLRPERVLHDLNTSSTIQTHPRQRRLSSSARPSNNTSPATQTSCWSTSSAWTLQLGSSALRGPAITHHRGSNTSCRSTPLAWTLQLCKAQQQHIFCNPDPPVYFISIGSSTLQGPAMIHPPRSNTSCGSTSSAQALHLF